MQDTINGQLLFDIGQEQFIHYQSGAFRITERNGYRYLDKADDTVLDGDRATRFNADDGQTFDLRHDGIGYRII